MKSIRRLLRQFISGEGRTPIIFPSVSSISSLNEVVTAINGPVELPENPTTPLDNLSYSSPSPTPAPVSPDRDGDVSHEVITIQSDLDDLSNDTSPPAVPTPPATAAALVDDGVGGVDGGDVTNNPADQLGQLLFQRLPTPPTTASTENESNENDENRVEAIRSPADLPSLSSSSDNDEPIENTVDSEPGLGSENSENQDQEQQDTSHPQRKGALDDLSVDASKLHQTEPYIAAYFRFLYYLGVVPLQFCARAEERFQLRLCHTTGYFCLLLIALIYPFYNLKACFLQSDYEKGVLKFWVTLTFMANTICLPIVFAVVIWKFKPNVASMIDTTKALANTCTLMGIPNFEMKKTAVLVTMSVAILTGLLYPLLYTASQSGFDAEEILRYQAQDLAYTLFAWESRLNLSSFYEEYEGDMDWKTISMGLTWGISSVIGCAYDHLVHDVPMWLAITMLGFTGCLSTTLSTPEIAQNQSQEIWIMYQLIREYSRQIDLYFGNFLQLVHFQNLFFSTYMLYFTIIEEDVGWFSLVHLANLGKMVVFYITSAKAENINDTLCTWLRENHRMDDIMYDNGTVGVTASVVIADVSSNPIGIGSKMFLVNKSSIWKGFGLIGSFFMFFVESSDAVVA